MIRCSYAFLACAIVQSGFSYAADAVYVASLSIPNGGPSAAHFPALIDYFTLGLLALLPSACLVAWFYRSPLLLANALMLATYLLLIQLLPAEALTQPLGTKPQLTALIALGLILCSWYLYLLFRLRDLSSPWRYLVWLMGLISVITPLTMADLLSQPTAAARPASTIAASLLLAMLFMASAALIAGRHHLTQAKLRQQLIKVQAASHQRLEHTVELRTRQLKASLQARNSLLARISHDLRSPLNHMIERAQHLNCANYQQESSKIVRAALRQLALLDDLMDFAQGELQQQELSPASGYLYAFLQEIAEEGRLLAEQRHNRFTWQVTGELPVLVEADFRQLRRVLINLLDNAAKFTRRGTIGLSLSATAPATHQVLLRFSITDNGPGLTPELQRRLLDPFQRGHHQESGYGLGLTIVAELLEQMNSRLEISTIPQGGSRFNFELMLKLGQEFEIDEVFIDHRVNNLDGSGYRVMLVDDVPLTLCYLGELLGGYGFDTLLMADGEQALAALATERVDLLITDQLMPNMSGWALLKQVRHRWPELPVLLYSALPPQPDAGLDSAAQPLRFNHALLKPASSDVFLQQVLHLCQAPPVSSDDGSVSAQALGLI